MGVALVVTLALVASASAPAGGARRAKLASPGISVVNVDAKLGDFYSEHLAQRLKLMGIEILTVREIQSLLGMERQKQLLGCSSEATSCIAELASALGADGVLLGDIARLGNRTTINVKVISAANGTSLALFSAAATNEDEVVDALTRGAQQLAVDASAALGLAPPKIGLTESVKGGGVPLRPISYAAIGVGVVLAAVGVGLVVWSNDDYRALQTGMPLAQGSALASRGPTNASLGVAALVTSGVALAAGVALFVLGGRTDSPVSVTAGPSGAAVLFRGALP